MNHHKKSRRGSSLADGAAHTQDHKNWTRRGFLRNVGMLGGASLMLGNMPVTALGMSPLSKALLNNEEDRILVLIRLKGGNDGLNTIIPVFDYSSYARYRPNIRINQNQMTNLNDSFAIPNQLGDVLPFWKEDAMRVVQNVGYPEQNLSHFSSSDIWASAKQESDLQLEKSGWLGRYLGDIYPDYLENAPSAPPAIQIGGFGSLTFNNMEAVNMSVTVSEPEELEDIAENGQLYPLDNLPDCVFGDQLGYLRTLTNSTFIYAENISAASERGTNAVDYNENNPLARQLRTVARLIKGNLGTKLYTVTLDGFDTHAGQLPNHGRLMSWLGSAINSFYTDLSAGGWGDKVLSMTYSEFGRRIQQNASNGTDHGAAAPLMLFGSALNGSGFVGPNPDLQNLDETGNLKYDIDFRQVYATVLEEWLCVDGGTVDTILGQHYERLSLGLECNSAFSVATQELASQAIRHYISDDGFGGKVLHYNLPKSAKVRVELYSIMGQKIATLQNGRQAAAAQQVRFYPRQYGLQQGQFFYQLQVDEVRLSGGVQFF